MADVAEYDCTARTFTERAFTPEELAHRALMDADEQTRRSLEQQALAEFEAHKAQLKAALPEAAHLALSAVLARYGVEL